MNRPTDYDRLQHPVGGGGLRAVRLEQHHRPGQECCETEGAGAGPPCGLVAAAIPKEAAGAAPPAPLQGREGGGNQDPVSD